MKPRCAACKKRNTKGEPDLVLCRMDPDNPMRASVRLVYHVRCQGTALERAAATPALWHMTHRYIEAEAN
jgi:hypothetical protein